MAWTRRSAWRTPGGSSSNCGTAATCWHQAGVHSRGYRCVHIVHADRFETLFEGDRPVRVDRRGEDAARPHRGGGAVVAEQAGLGLRRVHHHRAPAVGGQSCRRAQVTPPSLARFRRPRTHVADVHIEPFVRSVPAMPVPWRRARPRRPAMKGGIFSWAIWSPNFAFELFNRSSRLSAVRRLSFAEDQPPAAWQGLRAPPRCRTFPVRSCACGSRALRARH